MKILYTFLLFICGTSFAQDSLYSEVIASTTDRYTARAGSLDRNHYIGQTGLTFSLGFFTYLDSLGNILYHQTYSVSGDHNQTQFHQLITSSDDKFVLCGSSYLNSTNKWVGNLTKVDSTGSIIWSKQLKGINTNSFQLTALSESSDSTYLTAGVDLEGFNATFFEIDRNGNALNSFTLTSSEGYFSITSLLEISDTSILLLGSENPPFQNPKAIAICCSKTGVIYWTNSIDNAAFSDGEKGTNAIWIATRYAGELAVTSVSQSGPFNSLTTYGFSNSYTNNARICVIKDSTILLSDGESYIPAAILLKTVVGSTDISQLYPEFSPTDLVKREHDGAYVLGNGPLYGIKSANQFDHSSFIRIDSSFSSTLCLSNSTIGNATTVAVNNNALTSLSIDAAGSVSNLSLASETASLNTYIGCVDFLGSVTENELNFLSIYPNPGNGKLTIENSSNQMCNLRIRNSQGALLWEEKLMHPHQSIDWNELASGWYLIELIESETGNSLGKQAYIKN
ncbi:T9SS type A sorting domain-containing protein [uncultured Fluviicola sp.]|uniref:T9SS type A sorting domain-containing protein n=1 Tax=uncultured Fluviicola sp. TaxID=463303 RepID=UPI0025FACD76|nr:T9SS type A sorting domain-containing protein [uncultured Fluviicola sp.]